MTHPLAARSDVPGQHHEAYRVLAGRCDVGLILVCDHATNRFPDGYGTLGLPAEQLNRHIAYDIGAEAVTEGLSQRLRAPAVLSRFSRLFIDPNRGHDDPTLIMQLSDGAIIPGNRSLDAGERERRINGFYRPYHEAIERTIEQVAAAGVVPMLLSVHSFTEKWKETPRPWHITVLWDTDPRLPKPLLEELGRDPTLIVDENVPYIGGLVGDCMYSHGTLRGLPHALIEIRQDLIRTPEGQRRWVDWVASAMERIFARDDVMADLRHVASHAPAGAPYRPVSVTG
ncbi:MAG: N-formylglutamate amidohydrolase [Rhizobiales bacterium]|nr:N-formylglutamate amidohydrolase [Hyphomicrobiales bacterium]